MTVREGPHWVYDACDQGHDYQEEGEGICWCRCTRCGHIRYTRAHRVAVAREHAEKERAG